DVPAPLAGLLQRLLAKDPDGRPATPAEVADALAAPEAPGPTRASPRRRTRALTLVLLGAALLAGAAVAAFSWPRRGQPVVAQAPAEPALATPGQLGDRRRDLHQRALTWLRQNNCWGPDSQVVRDLGGPINQALAQYDGFFLALGPRLTWSG